MIGQRKKAKIFMSTEIFTKPDRVLQHVFNHNCFLMGNFEAEYIMRNAGLDEAQARIKVAGEISVTSDMQMTPPLWQKEKN